MSYRQMCASGLRLSALSLGGWTTFGGSLKDEALARRIINHALAAGINFFDIADIYAHGESERLMGRLLKDTPRHELVISSKVFWPMSEDVNDRGLSRKHIIESVEKSLKRIGTDYLDIYFCHRWDEDTPLQETLRAMDDLVRQGKILYWGTSEWTGDQLSDARYESDHWRAYAPAVEQPQYNLLTRSRVEHEIAPATRELGMGMVVWSPLASGLLSGKYDAGVPEGSRLGRIDWLREQLLVEDKLARVRQFSALAREFGATPSQLALAWILTRPWVSSVITGATTIEQLEENLGALTLQLDEVQVERIEALFPSPAPEG
ncbi:MAG: aldo/keto reductase [Candidatus Delongbacteria bacterium]|nr:aldo/keto reductase [Candidatus Delongbacteria bacterium]